MIRNLIAYFTNPMTRVLGFGYFGMSILFGSWASRIPDIQKGLLLDETQVGTALLGMSLGSFTMTFLSVYFIEKVGTAKSMLIGLIGMSAALLIPAISTNLAFLFVGLLMIGAFNGYINITVNNAVAEYEKQNKVTIMSTGHAIFSIGTMVGAGLGSIFVKNSVAPIAHFGIIASFTILVSIPAYSQYKKLPGGKLEGQAFQLPSAGVLALIFIGLCAMMGEGVIASWSGIFLELEKSIAPHISPLALTAFSGTMALGRLFGDQLKIVLGTKKLLAIACLLGGAGILIAILAQSSLIIITGFAITGLGYSVIVPVVFAMAARIPGVKPTAGIAMVAGAGVIGFLGAPPLVGMLSKLISLSTGFGIIAGITFLAFIVVLFQKD